MSTTLLNPIHVPAPFAEPTRTWFAVDAEGRIAQFDTVRAAVREDYPAAHSGDIQWFAIDAAGHIATFWSWIIPVVPKSYDYALLRAALGPFQGLEETSAKLSACAKQRLDELGVRSHNVLDLSAALHVLKEDWWGENQIDIGLERRKVQEFRRRRLGRTRMIVTSLDIVRPVLEAGLATLALQCLAGPPFAVEFADMPRDEAERIMRSGQCLCCLSRPQDEPASDGLFHYRHTFHEEAVHPQGPYSRDWAPSHPLTVDQLPNEVRVALEQVRFERLSFLDFPLLQPLEHLECGGAEQWKAFAGDDGRTMRPLPGASPDELAEAQRIWNESLQGIEKSRQQALHALANWPAALPRVGAESPSWRDVLVTRIEDYREANPSPAFPDLVRVALEFSSEDVAVDVYRQLLESESPEKKRLRGRSVVFHDAGVAPHPVLHYGDKHAPDAAYRWLDAKIAAGEFSEPKLELARPPMRPAGDALRRLRSDLRRLRERRRRLTDGRALTRAEFRKLKAGDNRDVIESVLAILLGCAGRRFKAPAEYYFADYQAIDRLPRIGRLMPLLSLATADDWRVCEQIVEYLPTTLDLQRVRLKLLSLAATSGEMPEDEVRRGLQRIFEGRDEELGLDELTELFVEAFALPSLPLAVLRQPLRAALVSAEIDLAAMPGFFGLAEAVARLRPMLAGVENGLSG